MLLDPIKTNLVRPAQSKIIYFDKTCGVKIIKLLIFFLDFQKSKDMEPSEIKFWRAQLDYVDTASLVKIDYFWLIRSD